MEAHPLYITSRSSLPSCSNLLSKLPIFALTALSLGSGYLMICSGLLHCRSLTASLQGPSCDMLCKAFASTFDSGGDEKHYLLVSLTLLQQLNALPAVPPFL